MFSLQRLIKKRLTCNYESLDRIRDLDLDRDLDFDLLRVGVRAPFNFNGRILSGLISFFGGSISIFDVVVVDVKYLPTLIAFVAEFDDDDDDAVGSPPSTICFKDCRRGLVLFVLTSSIASSWTSFGIPLD